MSIKSKTDNLPTSPAATGDAMTLTSAYNKAKTAAQPGDAMTLTAAYDAAKIAAPTAQSIWEFTTRTLTSGGSGSGISASDVWPYGTNSDMVGDIAAAVWGYMDTNQSTNSRTLTSGGGSGSLTAADVWNYGNTGSTITTRTLSGDVTVSSASIASIQSGLSTFDPTTDTVTLSASSITAVQSGLSTFDPTTDTVTLGSLTVGVNTLATESFVTTSLLGYESSSEDSDDEEGTGSVNGSLVATALIALEDKIDLLPDVIWGRETGDTESRTITTIAGLGIASESLVRGLVGGCVSTGSALGIKDMDGNTSVSLTVTRDSNNKIINIK